MTYRILILDDDRETCRFMEDLLAAPDRTLVSLNDPDEAIARIRHESFHLLISDLNLNSPRTGLDVMRVFRAEHPRSQVVLVSAFGSLETAIEAVRTGAFDFISKPFDIADVTRIVDLALKQAVRSDEAPAPIPAVPLGGLIGSTAPMLEVYKHIALAADAQASVLIVGESGTGKDLVARAIHAHGKRSREPFVAINCGAVVDTLLESELFGHVRGAFTGAVADRAGVFAEAGQGTVFLDEIGETSPALQVKLLRVLESGDVRPVGASRSVKVSARVIAATNADLEAELSAGRFRQDLYYRLNVFPIRLPPLRERPEDIPALVEYFLRTFRERGHRAVPGIAPDALRCLRAYPFPGNVRELENEIERAVALADDGQVLGPEHLSDRLRATASPAAPVTLNEAIEQLKRRMIEDALRECGSKTRAAERLGLSRQSLQQMLRRRS